MGEFRGKCGKGAKIVEFDPPATLTVEIENLGDCPVECALKDDKGKTVPLDTPKIEKGKNGSWSKTAARVELTCGKEAKDSKQDEHSPADKTDCRFKFKILYGDCEADISAKLTGDTYDKKAWSDFEKVKTTDGAVHLPKKHLGPSKNDEAGPVETEYKTGAPDSYFGLGYFFKVEVDVTADSNCEIVAVEREKTTFPDHTGAVAKQTADPIAAHSIPVKTPHHWVITDAPGFLYGGAGAEEDDVRNAAMNKIFHHEYKVTATIQRKDKSKFKISTRFEIKLEIDSNGKLKKS